MRRLSESLYAFDDSCVVYVIKHGTEAVLVDFGSGAVLDALAGIGVERVSDVLMSHHHRDQGQGLACLPKGARLWVPAMERELFDMAGERLRARQIYNDYNVREDRFSLLQAVPVHGVLSDYDSLTLGARAYRIVPTPGHTPGSISIACAIDGSSCVFSGDLIEGPGRLWSLAATQWTYNGGEGVAASVASLLDLRELAPDLLLPSHGQPMNAPLKAIDALIEGLRRLLALRGHNPRLLELHERPYEAISPHVLRSRASMANSFVLRSDSGKALFIDFGYDFMTGLAAGQDRAARRPWLHAIPALKSQFGITRIDAVLPTHYHDDHVAGINLLRRVEGARVLAPENFAEILEAPARYDLPCLWYDPIPVDERLPLDTPFRWEEYELSLHALPGHTLHAVAIAFEADGIRYLAIGDQYQGDAGMQLNYVYRNRYRVGDLVAGAELIARLKPELLLTGHWNPVKVDAAYFERLRARDAELEALFRELSPEGLDFGDGFFLARIEPYQSFATAGERVDYVARVRNPLAERAMAECALVLPKGLEADGEAGPWSLDLGPGEEGELRFCLRIPERAPDFAALALDVIVGGRRFGQQAEALLRLRPPGPA